MATVIDKGNPLADLDYSLVGHNRTGAGSPNGSVTPLFKGDRYLDTTNKVVWLAKGLANTDWVLDSPGTQDVVA